MNLSTSFGVVACLIKANIFRFVCIEAINKWTNKYIRSKKKIKKKVQWLCERCNLYQIVSNLFPFCLNSKSYFIYVFITLLDHRQDAIFFNSLMLVSNLECFYPWLVAIARPKTIIRNTIYSYLRREELYPFLSKGHPHKRKTQPAWPTIWTCVALSISLDDNRYTVHLWLLFFVLIGRI